MAEDNPQKRASKDFSTRLTKAKRFREAVEDDIEEVLLFVCPGREHDFDEASRYDPDEDVDAETFLSLPEDLALDFAADLVTYYCPSENRWTEYGVSRAAIEGFDEDEVLAVVEEREQALWEMIESSNFNDIAPQIMFEANHGTIAAWVDQAHFTQPFHIEAVPPHELLLVPGHLGILDRFRTQMISAGNLKVTFANYPDVDLSDQRIQNRMRNPADMLKVVWGFWVSWEDPGNPMWMAEITVDDIQVLPPTNLGPLAGSCPLLVGRFNPQINRPWGRGPAIKALPDLRKADRLDEAVLDGLDQALHTTLIYSNDGALDLSEGIEPDRAYPAGREFNRNNVFELNRQVQLDTGLITEDRVEERLRACFYQDGPRQRGDTPPTASQWLDERRRVQQRIGKPSAPLWTEFFLPFIQRVERIGVETGRFDAQVTINGTVVSINPVSPLQKAQNQDDLLTTRSNLDLAFAVLQDQAPAVIDMMATFENIRKASGDQLLVIREEDEAPSTQE